MKAPSLLEREKLVAWKDQFVKAAKKFDPRSPKPIIDLTKQQYKTLWKEMNTSRGSTTFCRSGEEPL